MLLVKDLESILGMHEVLHRFPRVLFNTIAVRVQPLISYFSYMHYHIIVLHSCVVLTVFDLLERCVSLVLRLALLGSWHSHHMVATWQSHDLTWELQ